MKKNNLNLLLTNMSKKFNEAEYHQATSTIYAILNSVTYGYDNPLSPQFLNNARDIYSKCSLARALNKTSNKISNYKLIKNSKENNIIDFSNFKKR
jgi:hypothetical protein